jgi:hypothetical protein
MRILFVLKQIALIRHFEEVVGYLVDVGHDVTLAPVQTGGDGAMPEALVGHPRCRCVQPRS